MEELSGCIAAELTFSFVLLAGRLLPLVRLHDLDSPPEEQRSESKQPQSDHSDDFYPLETHTCRCPKLSWRHPTPLTPSWRRTERPRRPRSHQLTPDGKITTTHELCGCERQTQNTSFETFQIPRVYLSESVLHDGDELLSAVRREVQQLRPTARTSLQSREDAVGQIQSVGDTCEKQRERRVFPRKRHERPPSRFNKRLKTFLPMRQRRDLGRCGHSKTV